MNISQHSNLIAITYTDEILTTHKLKFPWTAKDIKEAIISEKIQNIFLRGLIEKFTLIGAIEER